MTLSERAPFVRGQRVRVLNWTGPFAGCEGKVVSTDYADSIEVGFMRETDYSFKVRTVLYRADELERVEEKKQ